MRGDDCICFNDLSVGNPARNAGERQPLSKGSTTVTDDGDFGSLASRGMTKSLRKQSNRAVKKWILMLILPLVFACSTPEEKELKMANSAVSSGEFGEALPAF